MTLTSEYLIQVFGRGGKKKIKRRGKVQSTSKTKSLDDIIKPNNNKESKTISNNSKEPESISNFKEKYNSADSTTPKIEQNTPVTGNVGTITVNASAPPLDINSAPRQSTKNKGLRLAARKKLFLNKYGDALNSGFDNGLGLGVLGGLGYLLTKVLNPEYRQEIIARSRYNNTNQEGTPSNNQSDSTQSSTQNTSQTNTSNTSQTNTTPAQNNTSNASQTNTSTQKNTSRTTQANTSNRNTQATSNRQSQSKSRKTSSNKSNTASRKKLISKAQVKKAFADEFKKAYQNATIDVGNSSTRDYYSEALDLKSQLDKQRKDEVAKLQQQVQSLQNQLNQLTNPIY